MLIDGDDDEDDDKVLACVYEISSEDRDASDEEIPLQAGNCLDKLFTKTRSGRIAGEYQTFTKVKKFKLVLNALTGAG